VASVCDPTGSSTGYLPDGFGFNQITGAQSTSPSSGIQVITIPDPLPGEYFIVLRCIANGTSQLNITYLSRGESVFMHASSYEITRDSAWLIPMQLNLSDGKFISATVSDIEPLGDRAPEKLVRTEMVEELLLPFETPDKPMPTADNEHAYPLAVISSTGGSITEPGQGVFFYRYGTVVELVAKADAGWVFEGWTGNVADASSPVTRITMSQAEVVTASFVLKQ
jgi:hypothetical protein